MQGGYPGQPKRGGYPPQQGGYPPQQGGYPPQQGGYPPQQGGYPPQQGGYPPQQGGYPPQQGGYPPQQGGYPPQQQRPGGLQTAQSTQLTGWYAQYYQQIPPQQLQQLRSWFAGMDRDRSGSITSTELANVQFGQRPLGAPAAKKLVKVFDKDHSGTIDFKEYAALHQFITTMQNAFFHADGDRSGTLDAREIHTALVAASFQLSLPTVQAICKKFGKKPAGGRRGQRPAPAGLTFPDFIMCCAHLAHVRSIFEWNDTQRQGRVTFTYDQLSHVSTELLV